MCRAHVYGDNVDTDQIIPGRFLTTTDPEILGAHCMENLDPDFADRFEEGDILVAGTNFGSGSSREHAPLALQAVGARVVIAESFARIFFRNAINVGLPVLTLPDATKRINQGDELDIDIEAGVVRNKRTGESYDVPPRPEFIAEIINAGGLIEYGKRLQAGGMDIPAGTDAKSEY
jgi:3-isopropylmalate/(R)-2-methylmalate dehydratase small subunit